MSPLTNELHEREWMEGPFDVTGDRTALAMFTCCVTVNLQRAGFEARLTNACG
ncbi:MAG: hypothetical protein ACXW1O_08010 [Halobacteriota archaeon]